MNPNRKKLVEYYEKVGIKLDAGEIIHHNRRQRSHCFWHDGLAWMKGTKSSFPNLSTPTTMDLL